MSPDCLDNPVWQYYPRHRHATREDWDNKIPHKRSAERGGLSKYNPYLFGSDEEVSELEMRCHRTGVLIEFREAHYLYVGLVVGVCSGDETEYVFAECSSGFVHGRPISITALKKMGVEV